MFYSLSSTKDTKHKIVASLNATEIKQEMYEKKRKKNWKRSKRKKKQNLIKSELLLNLCIALHQMQKSPGSIFLLFHFLCVGLIYWKNDHLNFHIHPFLCELFVFLFFFLNPTLTQGLQRLRQLEDWFLHEPYPGFRLDICRSELFRYPFLSAAHSAIFIWKAFTIFLCFTTCKALL